MFVAIPVALVVGLLSVPGAPVALPRTERLSVHTGGGQLANGSAFFERASVSGDGRWVAFTSASGVVLLRDRTADSTTVVGVGPRGQIIRGRQPSISDDGSVVAWVAPDGAHVHDLSRKLLYRVTNPLGRRAAYVVRAELSGDGEHLVMVVVPDGPQSALQVVVRDLRTQRTHLVSATPAGRPGDGASDDAAVSRDGQVVAFRSRADDLGTGAPQSASAELLVRDLRSGALQRLTGTGRALTAPGPPGLSGDGCVVAFAAAGSTFAPLIVAVERRTGRAERVDQSTKGAPANGFGEQAPALSYDGSIVAFDSYATNLVAGDTNQTSDVFVRDRRNGRTSRASVATSGLQSDQLSGGQDVSSDGRTVVFTSDASTLVPHDTNGSTDVFARDLAPDP